MEDPTDEALQRKLFRFYQPYIKAAVLRAGGRWQTYEDERVEISFQLLRGIAAHKLTNRRVVESYLAKVARSLTTKSEQRERRSADEPEVEAVQPGSTIAGATLPIWAWRSTVKI